jgi:hypothetical protein
MWIISNESDDFQKKSLPVPPNMFRLPIVDYHPEKKDWLLFLGGICPDSSVGCHTKAYYSKDNGERWDPLEEWAEKCVFGRDMKFKDINEKAVFCSAWKDKNNRAGQETLTGIQNAANPLQLILFKEFDKPERSPIFSGLLDFFAFDNYMAAATVSDLCMIKSRIQLHVT